MNISGNLMYVTEADPHNSAPREPLSGTKLRAHLMLLAMFYDKLMVGDSQIINNPHLRSLIWPGEPSVEPEMPVDLGLLLQKGVLFPAIRSGMSSLSSVWQDLEDRKTEGISSREYVHFVEDSLRGEYPISYDGRMVSALFQEQVLASLAPDNEEVRLGRSIRQAAYDHVAMQETLYYKKFRDWMREQMDVGRMSEYHRRVLEKVFSAAYRHNVPKAIDGSQIDVPLEKSRFWTPVEIKLGSPNLASRSTSAGFATYPMQPFVISQHVLGRIRAQTLLAIMDDPARRPVVRQIRTFCRTGSADFQRFRDDVEKFLASAQEIIYADANKQLRELINRRKRAQGKARLTVARDVGLAVAGLDIWHTVGQIGGDVASAAGYTGLAITAFASYQTLRHFNEAYRHGWALGASIPNEHRLVLPQRE
jgi:hypothetical protein